jgi:ABC-2 type transport system ATP-binding protein
VIRRAAGAAVLLPLLAATPALASAASTAGGTQYTVNTLHFDVVVGPAGQTEHCDVIGDLYTPSSATKAHPAPAILTTNGFGGSKDDQAPQAKAFASRGYVVLSYSGLGFGGSGCDIELDDPDWDGKAASQLVTFLGGGSAAKDGTRVDDVLLDPKAHDGKHHAFDPRVGMIGGSYGGQVQFAVAEQDPRVDMIVPIITWNDLSYSLAPNNTSQQHGVTYTTPGVEKAEWTSAFFALGIADSKDSPPPPASSCPNFDPRVCPAKAELDATGYPTPDTLALARHASVASYVSRIRIPTLLAQGQADTLFNLQESVATYQALKAQGTPVALIWQSWGHSNSTPAPGELDLANPTQSYEGQVFAAWFDHYLKGIGPRPALDFSYFRDWVWYQGIATPAYAHAASYPVGVVQRLYLSGSSSSAPGTLTPTAASVQPGTSTFAAIPGAPASYSETSAVGSELNGQDPPHDTPGTYAAFASAPLATNVDSVGIPTLDLTVQSPTAAQTAAGGPGGELVLFAKIYDVAPDGSLTLVHRLISPVRIGNLGNMSSVHIALPGIVHRFPAGHRLEVVVATSDAAYRGNNAPQTVDIVTGPSAPGLLSLPTLSQPAFSG